MKQLQHRKVHWNADEEFNFLYVYSSLLLDHPDMGIGERIIKAMNVCVDLGKLSSDRIRPFHNTSFLDPYREKLVVMREKVLRDRHDQAEKDAAEKAAKALENKDPAVEAMIKQVLVFLDDRRIQAKLRDILVARPLYETAHAPKHDPVPVQAARARLKKILIIGLKGVQMETIKRGYGHKFDLKFIDKDAARPLIKSNVQTHDVLISMIGFSSHAIDDICSGAVDKDKSKVFKRVSGTVTDLQRVLSGIEA